MSFIKIKKPKLLLLVYDNSSIECRNVREDGTVGPAKRLYQKTINKIFKEMNTDIVSWEFKNRISKNVIYVNNAKEIVVWYQKPQVKRLIFQTKKHNGNYALPGLVFKISGGKLNVVAVEGIYDGSKVFGAPVNNLYDNAICLGNASLKLQNYKYYEDIIAHAEDQFYNSRFTGSPDKKLKNKDAKEFDNKHLKPHPVFKQLKDYIYAKNT